MSTGERSRLANQKNAPSNDPIKGTELQRRAFLGKVPTGGVKLTQDERKEFRAYKRGNTVFRNGTRNALGHLNYFKVRFQPRIIQS